MQSNESKENYSTVQSSTPNSRSYLDQSLNMTPSRLSTEKGSHSHKELSSNIRPQSIKNSLKESYYGEINSFSSTPSLIALVVDDVMSNRKMLAMLLKKRGVEAMQVNNGQEALEMVSENPNAYKLILMDNLMPVMNGLDATRQLRKSGFCHLIVGVTGNVMDDDINEFIDAGADMVLPKPFDMELFDKLLKSVEHNGSSSQYPDSRLVNSTASNLLLWKAKN